MSFGDINRVNTNLQALSSQYSLNKINSRLADNQLKLSTGLRINKAEDDAAGFSIASKLSGRIAGLEQAQRNVGDAKSMLDIAESGFDSLMDIMVEMKSKATQAANDSLGSTERGYLKTQIEALSQEINEIADQTTFQGTALMDGASLTFQVGEGSGDTKSVSIASSRADDFFSTASSAVSASSDTTGITLTDATRSTFNTFLDNIDSAIDTLAGTVNQLGIDQNSLSIRQENLSQAITSNSAARSRIQDADFAKIQSESVKLQIMQQTATSALAQANTSPQAVLGFLGG
ncbi:MAG: flagellin [Balneolaceae bacterium]|nr:flagellin [Balneolaceae bacterium]